MKNLVLQRCHNHPQREAVALCPECGDYYCRECIVEHEDRVLCASCLARLLAGIPARRPRLAGLVIAGRFLLGFLILWVTFYYMAQALLSLPTAFHEGTVWEDAGLENK
jgi:uncharacterized paraquat-inducible protein A